MRILRHKLVGDEADDHVLPFARAANIDEHITPELVLLHDTASRLKRGAVAQYLRQSKAVSVHFVIERDGAIEQQIPTNRAGDHAGQSSYHGVPSVNGFSIGIELVNPGLMTKAGKGFVRTWWGQTFPIDSEDHVIDWIETPEHGAGYWMAHTSAQVESLVELLLALFEGVPSLVDIRGHWYVSPGRKVDPNPHLPIETLRAAILGRTDPSLKVADAQSWPESDDLYRVVTGGSDLNLRQWPSFNPNIVAGIPDGVVVAGLRVGEFDGRRWVKVAFNGIEGWVVARLVEKVVS